MKQSFKTRIFNGTRLLFRNRLAESLLYPLTKGKRWNQLIARVPANYYQYPKNSIRNVERNGFQLSLDLSDYMQWLLYFGILAEPRENLYSMISPGMIVFDVGANIGETSMHFSRLCGKGQVISFEPDPDTFLQLENHLRNNRCDNVNALNLGLGKNEMEMKLEEKENNSGGHRIAVDQDSDGKKIKLSTLDRIVKKLNLSRVDFIKIDVEGYEFEVLQGAKETIDKFHPVFFIEINDSLLNDHKTSAKELTAFLFSKNYRMKNAENGNEINPDMNFSGLHFDIIAVQK
jgi:FkbM family methyltransferase